MKAVDQRSLDSGPADEMNAQLSQTRLVLVWHQMHILEIQLLELIEEPVGQASRLNEPGQPALLLGALGFTDFVYLRISVNIPGFERLMSIILGRLSKL